jgi:hypothetical protein
MTTLPTLTGSPKQIAWATSIRETAINAIEAKIAETGIEFNDLQQAVYDFLRGQSDASFWIDNRASRDYAGGWMERAYGIYKAR